MDRDLQVATLGNESVADGDSEAYVIPFAIAIGAAISAVILLFQYAEYWVCKHVFGREDPIDPDELLKGLSDEQRSKVLEIVVTKGSSSSTSSDEGATNDAAQEKMPEKTVKKGWKSKLFKTKVMKKGEGEGNPSESGGVELQELPGSEKRIQPLSSQELSEAEAAEARGGSKADLEKGISAKEGESETNGDNLQIAEDAVSISGDSENEQVCPICLGPYDDTEPTFSSQHCSHKFHGSCILEWLRSKDRNDCPVCRTEVISKEEMVTAALELVRKEKEEEKTASREEQEETS